MTELGLSPAHQARLQLQPCHLATLILCMCPSLPERPFLFYDMGSPW